MIVSDHLGSGSVDIISMLIIVIIAVLLYHYN